MTTSNSDEQLEDAEDTVGYDVASAMGFGSFGSKPHLTKKRKMNTTDNTGSGSNSLPLGMRPLKETVVNTTQASETQHESEAKVPGEGPAERQDLAKPPETTGVVPQNHSQVLLHQYQSIASNNQASRSSSGKLPNGEWDWQALRKGVRDERGDMAYYDASFVEDPWAALEREG